MWHSVNDSAHFEHALCPHRNATFHAFSRHIEQMCDSSSRSILYRSSISWAASIDSSRCRLISRPPANNTLSSQHNSCPQWHTVQPCYQTRNESSIYQVHVHCGQVRVHIQIRDCTILTQQYKITIRAATSTPSSILLEYFYYSGLIPLFTKYIMVKRQLTVSINPSTTPWETSQKTQTTVKPFNLAALKVGEFTWDDFRCLCIRLVCYCIAAKFGLKQGLNFRMAESPSSAKRTLVWVWTPVIQMWPLYQRLTNWHGYVWYIQSEQWCHCWMLTVMILKKTPTSIPAVRVFNSTVHNYM